MTATLRAGAQRILDRLAQATQLVPVLDAMGLETVQAWQENITRGRSNFHRFPKLSEPYATRKAKLYPGKPILEATGSMRNGLAHQAAQLGPTKFRLTIGVSGSSTSPKGKTVLNGDKALWHIQGTPTMPARKFTALPTRFFDMALSREMKNRMGARPSARA